MSKLTLLLFSLFLMSCQVEKKSGGDDYISDHRRATNNFTISNSQSGTFKEAQTLTFTLSFPSSILVTGNPQLDLEIGSTTRKATYQSGAGTKNLIFTYVIDPTDNDSDGIRFQGIDLNGGALQFNLKGEITDCSTTISAVHYSSIFIDNTAPTIIGISHAHVPGIYNKNDVLNFSVRFSESIVVAGAGVPELDLLFTTGATQKAKYVSGSGTDLLIFRYTIPADTDANVATNTGIGFPASIALNGSSIRDTFGTNLINAIPAAVTTAARVSTTILQVDNRIPRLLTVDLPTNGSYGASQEVDFTLIFDRDVNIFGVTRLELTVGSTAKHADYLNGNGTDELTFRYVPIPGDEDIDGITLNNTIIFPTPATDYISSTNGTTAPYRFNNIALNNNLKNPLTSGILITAVQPKIINIARTNDSTNSLRTNAPDNIWNIGQDLFLQVQFNTPIYVYNDNGSPSLNFTIGGMTRTATYLSGGDGQTTLVFRYTVVEGDDSNGADIGVGTFNLNNSVIEDARETQAQVTIDQTTVPQTVIDGVRPQITTVERAAILDGTYSTIAPLTTLAFEVQFTEPVVLTANNVSSIPITIGANTRSAQADQLLSDGTGNRFLTFNYTIVNTDNDNDGIAISSPITNATNVRDDAGNTAVDLTFAPPALTNVLVDTTRPTILSVVEPASGTYVEGDTLSFTVNFSEPVTYNGAPSIRLNIEGTVNATVTTPALPYTTSLTFSYTIANNLLSSGISFMALETATRNAIVDMGRYNIGAVNLPPMGNTIAVDSRAPALTPSLISSAGHYEVNDVIQVRLTANENVLVTGNPILRANLGGSNVDFEYQPTGSSSTVLIFEYTVTLSDFDFDGLGSISTLTNFEDIEDSVGNHPVATLASSLNMSGIKIKPTSFLAWSDGQLTNVYDGSTAFSGASSAPCTEGNCLVVNASSLSTNISGADTIYTRMRIDAASVSETILESFIIEDDSGFIVLSGPDIGNILINGTPVSHTAGKYHLNQAFGSFFNMEANLSSSVTTITGPTFEGQFRHLFLFDSPLNAAHRAALPTN